MFVCLFASCSMNFLFNISFLAVCSFFWENSPSEHTFYLLFDCLHVPYNWTFFSKKKCHRKSKYFDWQKWRKGQCASNVNCFRVASQILSSNSRVFKSFPGFFLNFPGFVLWKFQDFPTLKKNAQIKIFPWFLIKKYSLE